MNNPRHFSVVVLSGLLAMGAAGCPVAFAGGAGGSLSVTANDGSGHLAWHETGKALELRSSGGAGIRVTKAEPDGVLGLRQGDEILAVNGNKIGSVSGLVQRLRALKPAPAVMLLRRGGSSVTVTIEAARYMQIVPPTPPEPPAIPAPPSPPPMH